MNKAFLLVLILVIAAIGVGGFAYNYVRAGGTSNVDVCGLCPIAFLRSGFSNSSVQRTSLQLSIRVAVNETVLVVTHGGILGENVTSVTDNFGTGFVRYARVGTTLSEGYEDLWAGKVASAVNAVDTITVVWSASDQVMFEALVYAGVGGIGVVSTNTNQGFSTVSLSTSLVVGNRGSWVLGVGGTNNVGPITYCGGLVLDSSYKPRISACGYGGAANPLFIVVGDNATRLGLHFSKSLTVSASDGVTAQSIDVIEAELLQANPDLLANPCLSAKICTFYSLKASGSNVANQNLAAGTVYCTGVTSGPLVVAGGSSIQFVGGYSLKSNNVTGQIFTVVGFVTTTVPPTTFTSSCSVNNNGNFAETIYCPNTVNYFTASVNFDTGVLVAGTYYATFTVAPSTTNVQINSAGALGSVTLPGSYIGLMMLY